MEALLFPSSLAELLDEIVRGCKLAGVVKIDLFAVRILSIVLVHVLCYSPIFVVLSVDNYGVHHVLLGDGAGGLLPVAVRHDVTLVQRGRERGPRAVNQQVVLVVSGSLRLNDLVGRRHQGAGVEVGRLAGG